MSRAYDGADTGYRLETKGLLSGSSDKLAQREVRILRQRSHDLCRNNPIAITAQGTLRNQWIGTGIKVKWDSKVVQKEWDKFARSPSIDGWSNMYGLQSLWASSYFESGEVFTRMVIQDSKDRKVPLLLQTMEAEQLPMTVMSGQSPLQSRYGITFDAWGKPLVYNFLKHYPNESVYGEFSGIVPVDSRDVLHIFQRTRPGQWRGIPLLAGSMLPIYEMDELQDATLVRQKAAQGVGWVVYTEDGLSPTLLGNIESPYSSQDDKKSDETRLERIKPGGIHYLRSKEKVVFATTEDIGDNLTVLLQYQTRLVAASLEVTYEQLSGDLTQVNFSSIRAGMVEVRRKAATIQQLVFITQGMKPLVERFQELGGIYASEEFLTAKCKFVLPKWDWVDPLKDVQADLLEVRAGFSTMAEKLAERGVEDAEEHIARLIEEQNLDIVVESNPKHNLSDTTQPATKTTNKKKVKS